MKFALLKGTAAAGVAFSAGQHEFTMQKSVVDKIVLHMRRQNAGTFTEAFLKAVRIRLRWVAPGVDIELFDGSLWFMSMLTDAKGGSSRDWTETDLTYVDIVHPVGVDLSGDGVIQGQIIVPAANASADLLYRLAEVDDGSRPPAYRFRELTTAGNVAYESAVALYTWDETGNGIDVQVENDKRKEFPFALGRALFAEEAKIEADTEFCRLFSAPRPTRVNLNAAAQLTIGSVEVP